ncbi:MAG: transcriptional activator NhaR [Chitinivorax sp.]
MKPDRLNYKHLYYFWVAAKEGGVMRAAERLQMSPQTVSGQISLLEQALGKSLFTLQGRRLSLTEAGRIALSHADQIFLLGEQMQDALQSAAIDRTLRLTVGISDALPKLIAYRLLENVLQLPEQVRLVCFEGKFEALLGDLALHKLDVVLTDRPASPGTGLRVYSHALGDDSVTLYADQSMVQRYSSGFPHSLDGAPMLLPTRNNALRARLEQWFESQGIRPLIVGEFEDNALLMTFGRAGLGVFPATTALAPTIAEQYGAAAIGEIGAVREQFYAISTERRIRHPAVEAICRQEPPADRS